MRRFDQHRMSDRPTNTALHQETEQKLQQLLKEREQPATPFVLPALSTPVSTSSDSNYTPWKTPSTN